MEAKILSGVIRPNEGHRESGSVVIDVQDHILVSPDPDAELVDPTHIGPKRRFASKPAHMVALKEVYHRHWDTGAEEGTGAYLAEQWTIQDEFTDADWEHFEIRWETPRGPHSGKPTNEMHGEILGIAYMLIGEAKDPCG